MKYDFAGWASRNNIRCTDGRTIQQDAFKDMDGKRVPLVYMHNHKDVDAVIGHCILSNRPQGLWAEGYLNNTDMGQNAKELIEHGDVTALSIYANQLKESNGRVYHGRVREVSLVLAGANDGATIEYPIIEHSDGSWESDFEADEATIYMDSMSEHLYFDDSELEHADDEKKEEKKEVAGKPKDLEAILNGLPEDERNTVYAAFAYAVENAADLKKQTGEKDKGDDDEDDEDGGEAEHFDMEGDNDMKFNVFEGIAEDGSELSHADYMDLQQGVFDDVRGRGGRLSDAFLAHAAEYGIESIDYLFPDAKNINGTTPEFLDRNQEWVKVVMAGVHHTPFSRIKTTYADITEDEARAKGYMKGNRKTEEVFGLLRRVTTPTTVYKKQKMDRDDIIDITDFDVVAWIKGEMRGKLDEELARAYIFGDGRSPLSQDKIKEDNIRPILKEDDLFCIKWDVAQGVDADATAKAIIRGAIKSRKGYRGSGSPIAFMTEDLLSDMLLLEDGIGHPLYADEQKLATKLRVSRIVTIPEEYAPADFYMLIVNLNDYNVGADKGGSVNMFEDFDIDYNQEKYLIETRCSGALIKPYSAIYIRKQA